MRKFVPSCCAHRWNATDTIDRLLNVNAPLRGRSSCRLHLVLHSFCDCWKTALRENLSRERAVQFGLDCTDFVGNGIFSYFIIRFLGLGDVNGMYYIYYASSQVIKYLLFLIKLRYLLKIIDFKLHIFFYNIIFSIFYIFLII